MATQQQERVTCYQKLIGAPMPPFAAIVLAAVGSSRIKIKVGKLEYVVSRAVCSTEKVKQT